MSNRVSRRTALSTLAASGAALGLGATFASPARALTAQGASDFVTKLVAEIQRTVDSGKTGNALYRDFERIFDQYADVPIIAQSVLGADGRSATNAQKRAFADAFSGYLARKYGKNFRDFIGARIEVKRSRPIRSFYEVTTTAYLKGQSPTEVIFLVSDRSGRDKVFNIVVEGINMTTSERTEIAAMLDKSGSFDAMVANLRKAG